MARGVITRIVEAVQSGSMKSDDAVEQIDEHIELESRHSAYKLGALAIVAVAGLLGLLIQHGCTESKIKLQNQTREQTCEARYQEGWNKGRDKALEMIQTCAQLKP
jgi:ferric-dicitrate binding protein FerR (iron transport regulator)